MDGIEENIPRVSDTSDWQPGMSRDQTGGAGDSPAPGDTAGGKCRHILLLIVSRRTGATEYCLLPASPRPEEGDVGLVVEGDSHPQDHDSLPSSLPQPISESAASAHSSRARLLLLSAHNQSPSLKS